ncbi:MAG TPA: dicarboxylate/amino acid:cation symporter [Candidatus Dormibacteraeota bacterium]|nr:dicarboxylate/amino acid:cation symporter [Candidatus Dormibacteraeota bacterium]
MRQSVTQAKTRLAPDVQLAVYWNHSAARMKQKPFYSQLYFWVLVGMLLGVVVGLGIPAGRPFKTHLFGADFSFDATDLKPLSDAFIKLIRMMIAPIIFTTVVTGIAGMGNLKRLGRIGLKSFVYFEIMTTLALTIGWVVAAVFRPGSGMNIDVGALSTKDLQQTLSQAQAHHTIIDFLLNIIPKTVFGAFADGEILQVLFFSVLFGIAMAGIGDANQRVILALEEISKALMRMIGMIIKLAPFAVFGAMSFTIAKFGIASLLPLARMMACIYLTCVCFVLICLGTLLRFNGINILKFIRYVREELFIVFGTASSESVLPRMMARMENLGCPKTLVGLVLPAGYTFNLDGSSVYLTMGALFIAQATNTHLTFGQELAVLVVCLLTSKGAATVVGSAFITLAATLSSMKTIPVEGMVLILGVDWFMAQARAMTNMVGNGVATVVIARWENEFDVAQAQRVLNGDQPPPVKQTESVKMPETPAEAVRVTNS